MLGEENGVGCTEMSLFLLKYPFPLPCSPLPGPLMIMVGEIWSKKGKVLEYKWAFKVYEKA